MTVANAGKSIAVDKLQTIFNPLTRGTADRNAPTPTRNLGLGLYITKQIMVAHGGEIGVTSSDQDGTIFTARFPRV